MLIIRRRIGNYVWWWVLTRLSVVIILWSLQISNHYAIHLTLTQCYISIIPQLTTTTKTVSLKQSHAKEMWGLKLQHMNLEGTWFSPYQESYHRTAFSGLQEPSILFPISFAIQKTQNGRWDSHQFHLSGSQDSLLSPDSKSQASRV